jgi:hypothetical protein
VASIVTQEVDERGLFWRAEIPVPKGAYAPDGSVPGTLKIDREGKVTLELDNLLPRPQGDPPSQNAFGERYPIAGILKTSASNVRLEEAWHQGLHLRSESPSYQIFGAVACIMSQAPVPFARPEAYCTAIRLSLTGYDQWVGLAGANVKRTRGGIAARYRKRKALVWVLGDGKLTIDAELSGRAEELSASVRLDQQAYLTYTPRQPVTLDGVQELSTRFEDLLILLTNCERGCGQPQVKIKRQRGWATIYFTRLPQSSENVTAVGSWATLRQVEPIFGKIVDAWFAKHEEYGPAFHLYLGCRRGARMYLEHGFVNLVWGLESLHRQVGPPQDRSGVDAKIARILDHVPPGKDRTWLKGQLRHASDPSLADRLFDLISRLPISLDAKQVRAFVERCAKLRNQISHEGGERKHSGYSKWVVGLHPMSEALDPLYHALILLEIGVPKKRIEAIFGASYTAFPIRQALQQVGITLASVASTRSDRSSIGRPPSTDQASPAGENKVGPP